MLVAAGVVALLLPSTAAGADRCLAYEPAVVRLEGRIERHTYPGPPGFESLAAGDRPERVWILVLARPICVEGVPGDDVNIAESSVARIHLVLDEAQYEQYRPLVGHAAWAEGTLFHQITAHHHATLLLKVGRVGRRQRK